MEETAIERILRELKKVSDFVALLDTAEKQNCDLIDYIKMMDDEQQDILHEFELDKFYRTEGHRKARRLKTIRQKRRAAKDTIELWSPLKEFAKRNRKIKNELRETIEDINALIKEQNKRVYLPRINEKSTVAGKHYEAERINVIENIKEMERIKKEKKAK